MLSGVCSVTFRSLPPEEIIALAVQAGLNCIEWGGDVHVPHGDLQCARRVNQLCAAAGLQTLSYGSYYRAGESEALGLSFQQVLDTAEVLGAGVVRIWAGTRASGQVAPAYRRQVTEDALRAAALASERGLRVAFEFHGGTLTDSVASALTLLQEAAHPALGIYWQPPVGMSQSECIEGLRAVLPWLMNVHVFQWQMQEGQVRRSPLAEGAGCWPGYLKLAEQSGRPLAALLEFVRGDDREQWMDDSVTLNKWIEKL